MMKKSSFFIFSVVALTISMAVMSCSCAIAMPSENSRKAVVDCHAEAQSDSSPSECCGRCESETLAIIKTNASKNVAPKSFFQTLSFELTASTIYSIPEAWTGLPYWQLEPIHDDFSFQGFPRAPPVTK